MTLSTQERSLCIEINTEIGVEEALEILCRHEGIFAIAQQRPTSDEVARSMCLFAFEECVAM